MLNNKDKYHVNAMCRVLKISESGYYRWLKKMKKETDKSIGETQKYSVRRRLEQYRLQQKAEQSTEHYISHDDEEWEL